MKSEVLEHIEIIEKYLTSNGIDFKSYNPHQKADLILAYTLGRNSRI